VVLLFLIAMITDFLTPQDSNLYPMIGYLACCLLGIVPILTAAFDALCRKQVCFLLLLLGFVIDDDFCDRNLLLILYLFCYLDRYPYSYVSGNYWGTCKWRIFRCFTRYYSFHCCK
jgi:hypothetical protein